MALLWLALGILIGTLNGMMQLWTVRRLAPNADVLTVNWIVLGAFVRWTLVAALFILALQVGVAPALLAFAGMFVAKWIVITFYGLRG